MMEKLKKAWLIPGRCHGEEQKEGGFKSDNLFEDKLFVTISKTLKEL
jgi:hypothetical protein